MFARPYESADRADCLRAFEATVSLIISVKGFGTVGLLIGLAVAVVAWITAIRMYRRGAEADNR